LGIINCYFILLDKFCLVTDEISHGEKFAFGPDIARKSPVKNGIAPAIILSPAHQKLERGQIQ
jgi:hypothetical protein